ncbi:histidine kinase N-terminal 7TM domain-containing protein [Halorubrum sp. DTA46]|uniref:histidine kinase N-terminal 7TM domain-containing protein n=1 Tax=Halorubrum sp. DTA46 TaxID=3402162 RepID=UPI003AACCE8F
MKAVFLAHVALFALSALTCLAAIPRAVRVGHPETREGLVGLLVTVAVWSGGYVGYLIAPGESLKLAFYIVGFVFALFAVGAWLYFCAAYTGRSPRHAPYRWVMVGVFVGTSLLKITNPLHELYFTTTWVTEPFPHLAIQHGLLYWVVLGISYAVIAIGFFMLLEQFYYSGADSRPLVVLISVTGIPTIATLAGGEISWLLPLMYEPPGVALFAVGTLFIYIRRFETIQFAAESADAAIFLDRSGNVRDFNRAARVLFPSLRGSIGDPLDAVIPRLAADHDGSDVISIEGATREEGNGPTRTGASTEETRFFHVSRNAFTTGGVASGALLTIDDVTDRERYRVRLEERTNQLEALNRVVRHDIRNDMAVVHGWAETLRDHVDEDGQDALDRVLRKSAHVIELTDTARDFVDSLTGDAVLDVKSVSLCDVLDVEVQAARDSFPNATFEMPADPPRVDVLANEMLGSVFRNLLNNAVQHNDTDAPEVTVTCDETADRIRVRIADNGPGVSDAEKPEIFGKGQKGVESAGSGIGLYLVYVLSRQFGGDVWVEDNTPRGAVFVVELARADNGSTDIGDDQGDGNRHEGGHRAPNQRE